MAVARDELRADPTGSCAVSGTPELVPLTARGLAVRPLYWVGVTGCRGGGVEGTQPPLLCAPEPAGISLEKR